MRILHFIDSLGIGGTENGLANVIEGTRGRIEHIVACVRQAGAVADRLRAGGTEVIVLGKTDGNDVRLPLRMMRLCRQLSPDIVHTRNWGTIEGIVAARLTRVRVVIHGEHGREAADPEGKNRLRNRTRRLLAPLANRVVTVSEQLRRWLVSDVGIAGDKIALLRNGVDVHRFQPLGKDRAVRRAAYGLGPSDIVAGTVGRLDPVKNQLALLEALAVLRGEHRDLRVLIVGDGPERAALQRAVVERRLDGAARLLGMRDDVPELLGLMDLFVLPSVAEGLCNTMLEAMAAGLPVIATAVGGNPELVADGRSGQLIAPLDPNALAQAIARYATDPNLRRQHGTAGRARAVEEFALDAMVARYAEMYEREVGK
jgi:sugar transferase (PEP-CTERM/EpsH1 system associated)